MAADAPVVVVEQRMRAEVRSLAADRNRVVLDDRRAVAEEHRRHRSVGAEDRRRRKDPVIAARLMVVGEPLVVEQVVAEHHVVRPAALRRQEVGALREDIGVVALLRIADAAERRRPEARVAALPVEQQRSLDQIRARRARADEAEVARADPGFDGEMRAEHAVVAAGRKVLGQLAVVEAARVHRGGGVEGVVGLVLDDPGVRALEGLVRVQ